jgi:hypothetical protein
VPGAAAGDFDVPEPLEENLRREGRGDRRNGVQIPVLTGDPHRLSLED